MTSVFDEVRDMVTNAWQLLLEVQKELRIDTLPKGEFRTNYEKLLRKVGEFQAKASTFRQAFDPNKPRAFKGKNLYNEILGLVEFLRVGIENQQKWKDIVNAKKLAVESKQLAAYRSKLAELDDALTNLRNLDIPNDDVSKEFGKFSIETMVGYDQLAANIKSKIDSFVLPSDVSLDFSCLQEWYANEAKSQRCVEEIENASKGLERKTIAIEKTLENVQTVRVSADRLFSDSEKVIKQLRDEFNQLSQEYLNIYRSFGGKIMSWAGYYALAAKKSEIFSSYENDPKNLLVDRSDAIELLKRLIESIRKTNIDFSDGIDIIQKGDKMYSDYLELIRPYGRYQELKNLHIAFVRIIDFDLRNSESTVETKRNFQRAQQKLDQIRAAIDTHEGIKKRLTDQLNDLKRTVVQLNEARKRSRALSLPFDELDANIERLERSKTISTSVFTERLENIRTAFNSNQLGTEPVVIRFVLQDKFYIDRTDIDLLDVQQQRIEQKAAEENAKISARASQKLQFADLETTVDDLIRELDKLIENTKERVANTRQLFQSFVDQARAQELNSLTLYYVEREVKQLRRSEFKDAVLQALQIDDLDAELDKARGVVEKANSLLEDLDGRLEGDKRLVQTLSQISVTDENVTEKDQQVDGMVKSFASPEPTREELVRRYKELEQEFVQYSQLARRIETEIQRQAQRKIDLEQAKIDTAARIKAFDERVVNEKVELERYAAVPDDWKQINQMWRSYELMCINGHRYTEFDNVGHWYCHQHAGEYLFGKWSCCDRTNPKDTGCVNADHRPSVRPFTDQQTIYNVHEFVLEQLGSRVGIEGSTIVRYDRQAHEARSGQARKRPLLDEQRGVPPHRKVTFINPVLRDLAIEDGTVELVGRENYFWDNDNGPVYVASTSIALAEVERFRVGRNTFAMGDVTTRVIEQRKGDDYVFASSFPGGPLDYVPVRQLYRS
jgi:hypothetical protein